MSRMRKSQIEFCGHACKDYVFSGLEGFPKRGKLTLGNGAVERAGGPGFAAALASAWYLGERGDCCFTGCFGEGNAADSLVEDAKAAGLSLRVKRSGAASVTAVLVETNGQRTFCHSRGANDKLTVTDLLQIPLAGRHLIHLGGWGLLGALEGNRQDRPPVEEFFAQARNADCRTSLDTVCLGKAAPGSKWRLLETLLMHMSYVFMSVDEAPYFTRLEKPQEVARCLIEYGADAVFVKAGSRGVWVMNAEWPKPFRIPAFCVPVVDTTGAGDVFCGVTLAELELNRHRDLALAAQRGAAAAAIVVSRGRGAYGTPTRQEVLKFIRARSR